MSRGRSDVPNTDDSGAGALRIGDRFVVERTLAAGELGEVFLARDLELGRGVAVKLHKDLEDVQRLHREALTMAQVAHPNVVSVFAVGEHAGRTYVAMEYVEGKTLRAWLAEAPRSRREVLGALLAAGEGLAAAHSAGLVHRDFRPESIVVGADGRVRVSDFGVPRRHAPVERPSTDDITFDGAAKVAATAYMAPEQFAGQRAGAAADQYAFAVVAYEALFGAGAQGGGRLRAVLLRAQSREPAARFPSLRALLVAMKRADRMRVYAIAGLVVLAAMVAALVAL
jgi:serine/threonine protein kinase